MSYASVVVGTDGSSTAEQAVRAAAELAGPAPLVVVTAYGSSPPTLDAATVVAERGRAVAEEAGATGAEARAAEGAPADVLLSVARESRADLIVVGSLGMTGPARFTLGGVANEITHHAPCDVLVVHTGG